jgi:hypothetical protein
MGSSPFRRVNEGANVDREFAFLIVCLFIFYWQINASRRWHRRHAESLLQKQLVLGSTTAGRRMLALFVCTVLMLGVLIAFQASRNI